MNKYYFISLVAVCSLAFMLISCRSEDVKDPTETEPEEDIIAPLENIAEYDFEVNELDLRFFKPSRYEGGSDASVCYDDQKGIVMFLNNGYVTIPNPYRDGKDSKAISMTFWMKQELQQEGNVTKPQDIEGALFSFENDNASGRLYFTANGVIAYHGVDGDWTDTDAAGLQTGYLAPAGEWHYVALTVKNSGYVLYVDGEEKKNKVVRDFDFSKAVSLINGVSHCHIGYGSGKATAPWKIDDLSFFRNVLTENEIKRPIMYSGDKPDPLSEFMYSAGDPVQTIGAKDCTTGWWKEFSNYYRIPTNGAIRLSFTNHTNFKGADKNWILCLANDKERGAEGYSEYFILRSNLDGSGDRFVKENLSGEGYGDWDKFIADMEGAEVSLDIRREGKVVYVDALAKAKNGNVYREIFHADCDNEGQTARAFLTVDGSCLELIPEKCRAYRKVDVKTLVIGNTDNSSGWSTAYSDYFYISPEANLQLEFTNYTNGQGNWNNWNLYITTNADRGDIRFKDYMLLRSDLYGWGESYSQDRWTHSGYGDWDLFRKDMNGANVVVEVEREGAKVTYISTATAANGNVYRESTWGVCGEGDRILRSFLCVDGSHFEMIPDGCYCYVPIYK
ncbi:MAG: LamG domain-containing protein [Bacteroides sp.]|nr:LamG domain-containing protein [Bacteroides sp.]